MATGNITKRAVEAAAPGPATTFLWDQEVKGFGLKVTPSGGRSYVYQYRVAGELPKFSDAPSERMALDAR